MSTYIQNFLRFRPLLSELMARDIKIKYRRSVLGVLWTMLNPLMMMAILSVVYSNLFKFDVENFSIYLLSGQVMFNFFSESTTTAMSSILGNASLIKKVYVPKYLFVLSRICSTSINLMASFTALIFVMLVTRTELHYTILLVWIPISGNKSVAGGNHGEIQRYYAFIFGIRNSVDVFDSGNLSDVNFAVMVGLYCECKSADQLSYYVS